MPIEMSSFTSYCVLAEGKVITATDSFISAVEAVEATALEMARAVDPAVKVESVAILVDGSDDVKNVETTPGFYGRWEVYDERAATASMCVFQVRKKPDGYILAGSIKQKTLGAIVIQSAPVELFSGFYKSFEGASDDDSLSQCSSDDETYIARRH